MADLKADVTAMETFMQTRFGRVPEAFIKWRRTIRNLENPAADPYFQVPTFPKILELAKGKLALAEKAMERQETIRREVQRNLVGQ